MTLKQWEQVNKWLVVHATSRDEIRNILSVADRSLKDSGVTEISPEGRLGFAYTAALEFARAALAAAGYKPNKGTDHHVRVIDSLTHTIGWDSKRIRRLDAFRKARNLSSYERTGDVTDAQVSEAVELARALGADVRAWLTQHHPELL